MNKKLAIKCTQCVYAVNNNHCGLRGFRSNFNVNYCSAQNTDKLPNGFELQEDGYFSWINRNTKYPKTYDEWCNLMPLTDCIKMSRMLHRAYAILLEDFSKLLLCRDAYWKIAGDEMGLGKPWEPDWEDETQVKYMITTFNNKLEFFSSIHSYVVGRRNHILSFPTEEMRDAFYENFKDLIEQCKELL